MGTMLSLTLAVMASLGFLAGFYTLILAVFGARNRRARPTLHVTAGGMPGTIGVSVTWDTGVYAVQIWRIRLRFFSPARFVKDSQFTVTFDSAQKSSFFVPIELNNNFKDLIESNNQSNKAVISIEARGVENFVMAKDFRLPKIQKIYHSSLGKMGAAVTQLPVAKQDPPAVESLDYSELVVRRDRLKALAAAAKAKAKPAVVPAAKPVATPEVPAAGGT
ncbi:MAG: hypothetical protein HYR96_14650 [Deltaproteobacteria bacterium]|nr:hypothetical protein [Deltaproteobacteria bacterium]MBI3294842.1 hypothetical protein [Deltaproteobacteria bacterium]